jgi:hypothetical protein
MNSECIIYGISLALELAQGCRSQEYIDNDVANETSFQNLITSYDQSETIQHTLGSDKECCEDVDDKANDHSEMPWYHPLSQKTPF